MGIVKKFRIKSFKEQNSIVKLEKISMVYNKRTILNDITLAINRHEVLGLLGPNGVGKSTIFQIINGLQDPTYGKVIINNNECKKLTV